jgi:phosphopantetheinyl transferase
MILYIFDQYSGNKNKDLNTEALVTLALKQYLTETCIENFINHNDFRICRTQKGKPYIEGFPMHFSVSHSDHMWICLVGDSENGIDIQNMAHSNYEAIARRFFQPEEKKAVAAGGILSFFRIWCRKEAFIKLFGLTIGDTIDWLNVAKEEIPATQIEYMERRIVFSEIDVHPEYCCVAAMENREEIWVRKIQIE